MSQRVGFATIRGDYMRVLMCDVRTGRFYAADRRWTPRREEAWDFGSVVEASAFAGGNRLGGVELVLASDDPEEEQRVGLELEARQRDF